MELNKTRIPKASKRYVGVVLVAALTVAACGKKQDAAPDASAPAAGSVSSAAPVVAVVQVEQRSVSAAIQVTGSFAAKEASDVAPQAAGRVIETPVDVGDFVKQGQVIAKLEDRDPQLRLEQAQAAEQQAQAALRQAQSRIGLGQGQQFDPNTVPEVLGAKAAAESAAAQAKQADADAKRYENLIQTGDVSRSAYEKARTQADTALAQGNSARQQYEATLNAARQNFQGVSGAQASLEGIRAQAALAKKALDDTLIRAPFTGYVSARPVAVGQYVGLANKIATVLRITPIKLELQVPEVNAPQMKIGGVVEAKVPGYPGREFTGRVTAVSPAIDPNSRTFNVIAEFANADLALKPGMFATARIVLPGSSTGMFVPRAAVITDATTNSSQVFFVRDGRARVAVVQLGPDDGGQVQILSGIAEGAIIATDHLQDLYDGLAVQTNSAAAGKGK
ncbi:MAG: efflux RND transporter periplasmic adaptor subunit [Bryobacteraceae bacterium]